MTEQALRYGKPIYKLVSPSDPFGPAGAKGPFPVLTLDSIPRSRGERPVIATELSFTCRATISPGSMARLMRMACQGQMERLATIERLLAGDLSSLEQQREVTQQLAQFGDYEEGERVPLYVMSLPAAQAFARRILPGSTLGMWSNHTVLVTPPNDERLTREERSALWAQSVEPHPVAHPEALALLKVVVRLMTAIVRADLAKWEAQVSSDLPAVGSFHE